MTRREFRSRRFSTGIGGIGNVSSARRLEQPKEDDEMARLLHDIQAPGLVLVEGRHHTGIGGAANTYRPTAMEANEARINNENLRRQSVADQNRRRESWAAVLPIGDRSRRTSIADSMKDFITGRISRS